MESYQKKAVRIAIAAEKAGADLINVSAGTYETGNVTVEPTSFAQGWRMELAKRVKENVTVPVVATSVIREPEFAEQMLRTDILISLEWGDHGWPILSGVKRRLMVTAEISENVPAACTASKSRVHS